MTTSSGRPQLRIVRGEPTAEELAVLTAVVTAAAATAGRDEPTQPARGRWNDPAAHHRRTWLTGAGAWRGAVR